MGLVSSCPQTLIQYGKTNLEAGYVGSSLFQNIAFKVKILFQRAKRSCTNIKIWQNQIGKINLQLTDKYLVGTQNKQTCVKEVLSVNCPLVKLHE